MMYYFGNGSSLAALVISVLGTNQKVLYSCYETNLALQCYVILITVAACVLPWLVKNLAIGNFKNTIFYINK